MFVGIPLGDFQNDCSFLSLHQERKATSIGGAYYFHANLTLAQESPD